MPQNAIIRQALEKLSALVVAQPEKARAKNAPAIARLLNGLRCEVKGPNGESALTDMPPAVGGEASAPSPGWFLRASLASCTATSIAMEAAKQGIDLTMLEVSVESTSDNRGMLGLDGKIYAGLSLITTRVKISASDATPAQLRELAERGDRNSVVACTARSSPAYSIEVEIV